MSARAIVALAPLGAALAVAGCGGGGGGKTAAPAKPAGPASGLSLRADPGGQLKFNRRTLSAKAGRVTIVMDNPSELSHNVALEGPGIETQLGEVVAQDGTSKISATVKPGRYTFFCSVPGHREAGMVGTLIVR